MVPTAAVELVQIAPPPFIELTPEESEIFRSEDTQNLVGTSVHRVVRMGDALIGFHYNPNGVPPPEYAMLQRVAETYVIVHRHGQTRRLPLVPNHDFRNLIPSPSGRRFLVFNNKGPHPGGEVVIGGHVLEADLESLETSVALTGTTGRTPQMLGSKASADAMTLWGVDYVGDDDTLIASLTQHGAQQLVLFERDPATRAFVEVNRTQAPPNSTGVVAAGGLIATRTPAGLTVLVVVDHRLAELGAVATPVGSVLAYPEDTRQQLLFFDKTNYFHLVRGAP
jgi:hypothetical protein